MQLQCWCLHDPNTSAGSCEVLCRKQPENAGDWWSEGNHHVLVVIFCWDEEIQKQCGWIKQVQQGLKCERRRRKMLRTRLLAQGACSWSLWNKYINLWVKGSLPKFLQYPQQWKLDGIWCRSTVTFSTTFCTTRHLWTCVNSVTQQTHLLSHRTRKPPNLDYFRSKRGTYILSHLAFFKQVLCKSTDSYLGLHLFQVSGMLWDSLGWNFRAQFSLTD